MDDGSVLPDLAYITSAQLGRPFKVEWTEVPDRDATTTPVRKQLTPGVDVTPSKKLEGCWGDERGTYVVASFAFEESDLPADAVKHDGQVWYYDCAAETLTLVTYFPHNAATDSTDHAVKYQDLYFDGPDNVHVTPWGSHSRRGRRGCLARAQLDAWWRDVRHRAQPTLLQRRILGIHRPAFLIRRDRIVRQHPGAGHHAGDHRTVGPLPRLTTTVSCLGARDVRPRARHFVRRGSRRRLSGTSGGRGVAPRPGSYRYSYRLADSRILVVVSGAP